MDNQLLIEIWTWIKAGAIIYGSLFAILFVTALVFIIYTFIEIAK